MNNNDLVQQPDSAQSRRGERKTNISSDGKWKSFPQVPCLLRYQPSGVYFGRSKIDGKITRQSLETDVFTTAKLRLADYLKKHLKRAAKPILGTVGDARKAYETDIDADHTLKDGSKIYRRNCVKALLRTWAGLEESIPTKITEADCREWAGRFAAKYDDQFFNNTLGTLREILKRAGLGRDDNPAFQVKRLGVKPKELKLPEPKQFEELLTELENGGARQSKDCADLVRFLAFSGCRISEAGLVKWADVDLTRGEIRVETAKRAKTSGASSIRFIPIIPPLLELLTRLKEAKPSVEQNVCNVSECEKSLTRGCKVLKLHRMTHHDLRHLFATRCIESGVDIPTVSRWLGHSDGGALAMRTYGHLRREHSATMARLVNFSPENALA
ncbi:MAG: hypothetical protein QOF48_3617 [Verrucomicrobiota bacterium]|jgi:integrase